MPLFLSGDALITKITHSQANGKDLTTLTTYVHTFTQVDVEMEITIFHSSDLANGVSDLQQDDRIFFTGPATYEPTGWYVIANYFSIITGNDRIDALIFGTAFYEKTIRSTEEIVNFRVQTTNWHRQTNTSQKYECAADKTRFQKQIEKMRPTSGVIIQGLLSPHGGNPMNLYIVSMTYNSGTRMETNAPPQIQKTQPSHASRIANLFTNPTINKTTSQSKKLTISSGSNKKRKNAYGSDIAESDNNTMEEEPHNMSDNESLESDSAMPPKKKNSPKVKNTPSQQLTPKTPSKTIAKRRLSKR
jgi:hypothetical protein